MMGRIGQIGHGMRDVESPLPPLSEGERLNHEIWATCPVCGYEYDRRVWGDTCPECARETMRRIKEGVMREAQ